MSGINWSARRKASQKTIQDSAEKDYSWRSVIDEAKQRDADRAQKRIDSMLSNEDFGVMPTGNVTGSIAQKGYNTLIQKAVTTPILDYKRQESEYNKNVEAGAKARNMTIPAYEEFIQKEIEKQKELEKPTKAATGLMGIIADKIIKDKKRDSFTTPADNFVMEQTQKLMDSGVMKAGQVIGGGVGTGISGVQEGLLGFVKGAYAPSNEINKWAIEYAKSKGILIPNFNPYSMLDEFTKGSAQLRDVAKKNVGYYDASDNVRFVADLLENIPSQGLQAMPGGKFLYAMYSIGSNINQYIKGEQPWWKEWTMALGASGIDVGTEQIFPMFDKAKGAVYKMFAKALKKNPKFIPTFLDYAKGMGVSFAQEGFEEGLSYLGTTLLDWAVMKEMKGETGLNFKDANKQILMGAFSGLLMSGVPIVLSKSDAKNRQKLNDEISKILNKKPGEVTEADVSKAMQVMADVAIETGYAPGVATTATADSMRNKSQEERNRVMAKYGKIVGARPVDTTTSVAPIQQTPIAQEQATPTIQTQSDNVGDVAQQTSQNIVDNVNVQEASPVVESKPVSVYDEIDMLKSQLPIETKDVAYKSAYDSAMNKMGFKTFDDISNATQKKRDAFNIAFRDNLITEVQKSKPMESVITVDKPTLVYRGEGKSLKQGNLGVGTYVTETKGMAEWFAKEKGGKVSEYWVKSGLKLLDADSKTFVDAKKKFGLDYWQAFPFEGVANKFTEYVKSLGYDGIKSADIATGTLIFDKSNLLTDKPSTSESVANESELDVGSKFLEMYDELVVVGKRPDGTILAKTQDEISATGNNTKLAHIYSQDRMNAIIGNQEKYKSAIEKRKSSEIKEVQHIAEEKKLDDFHGYLADSPVLSAGKVKAWLLETKVPNFSDSNGSKNWKRYLDGAIGKTRFSAEEKVSTHNKDGTQKKTPSAEYRLFNKDGAFVIIPKTAYDYAKHLLSATENVTAPKTVAENATTSSTYLSAEQTKELGKVKANVVEKYIDEHKDMTEEEAKDSIAEALLGEGIHVNLKRFAFRELVDVLKDDNAKSLVKRFLGKLGDKIGTDAQATLDRMRMGDEEYSEFVTSYVKRTHKADMKLAEEHIKSDEKMIDLTLRANIGDTVLKPDEMLALMLKADTILNAPETYDGEHANWLATLDSVSSLATKMGQSISIIAKFYQETNRAKNLESTLVNKKEKKRIRDGVKEMEKFLEAERKKALAEIAKQIEAEFKAQAKSAIKDGKVDALSEKTDDTRTDAERFADRVDKIARTPITEVEESDKPLVNMVSELVSYVVEKNPKLATALPKGATALEKGAYIFRNRATYESTLDEGFRMIEDAYLRDPTKYPVDFLDTMHEYLNTTLYPTLKNARMDAIIKQVMKEKNFKLDEIVRDWVRSGESKFATLSEYIASKSGLSSSESDSMVSEIAFRMAKTRDAKRLAIIESMLKDKKALTPKTTADLLSEALSLRILHDPKYATITQSKTMAIVNRAMKEMNMSLPDIVIGYEKSGMRLKEYLMSQIKMSEADAIVLSNEIDARLREKIADRRNIIVKQLNQMQGEKGRIVKARKSLEDKLSEIVGLDLLNTDALRTIYAEKLNLPVFDDAMTKDVMDTVREINKLNKETDYEKITELWASLGNRISSKMKITWGDRAMAYRKTMMLSNPATQVRNVTSNWAMNIVRSFEDMFTRNVMGKVLRMQLSSTHEKYTKYHANVGSYAKEIAGGKRKIGDVFSAKIWGGTVSYNESVSEEIAKSVSSSWTTDGKPNILNNDKFKVLKAEWIFKTMRGQKKGIKRALQITEKGLDSLATTVRDSLKHGDLAFAESAYKNAMIGYMEKNGLKSPNADAITYANRAAEEATFRGVNAVSNWIAQGKRGHPVMKWLIDTVIPFAETPTNITKAVWERTGFSGAWNLKNWLVQNHNIKADPNWAKDNPDKYKSDDYYAQKFTRSIIGTFGGFGGGVLLQMLGFLTGAKPQDEKERKRWEMNGIIPYALHIPGTNIYVTLDWLQPAAAQLMVGASFAQAIQEDEGIIQALLSGASGGIDSIMNMTLFTSLKRVLGGQWQDASDSLFSIVESYANQFLPAYVGAISKTIDGTVRNTWSPEVGGNIATTYMVRSGLGSFFLMPKVDAWGNDVKQPQVTSLGILERSVNSFIAPWKVSNLKVDEVTKEVTDIFGKAVDGDAKQPGAVLPQIDISNPKAFPYDGDYYTLTEEEYYKYMKYRGQYAHAMIQALMADSEYNSLPDYAIDGDSKFSWISNVYDDAATKAKEKLGKPKNKNN